jgi:hypothetical protein
LSLTEADDLSTYLDDLEHWQPSDHASAAAFHRLSLGSTELHPVSSYSDGQGSVDGVIAFYSAATWGLPGERAMVALHIERYEQTQSFRLRCGMLPTEPLAAQWLATHGVPVGELVKNGRGQRHTDQLSARVEERIREDAAQRFRVVSDYTDDEEVWVVYEDRSPGDQPRYLAHLETIERDHPGDLDYRVLEARFASFDEAERWFDERGPLPLTSESLPPEAQRLGQFSGRARAARTALAAGGGAAASPTPADLGADAVHRPHRR